MCRILPIPQRRQVEGCLRLGPLSMIVIREIALHGGGRCASGLQIAHILLLGLQAYVRPAHGK
jgi:hypothetical protein